MADTGPRREEVAAAMVQSGTVGRMSMSPSPFYRRNNVSRGNALGVPKDCPGVRSALCPENDANALPKPISIHPPPVSFHWGRGRVRDSRWTRARFGFLRNEVAGCWMVAYRSVPPEKKEKKRLRLSMPTINGFYSSWERSRNERTWSKAKGEGNWNSSQREKLTRTKRRTVDNSSKLMARRKLPLRRNIKRNTSGK